MHWWTCWLEQASTFVCLFSKSLTPAQCCCRGFSIDSASRRCPAVFLQPVGQPGQIHAPSHLPAVRHFDLLVLLCVKHYETARHGKLSYGRLRLPVSDDDPRQIKRRMTPLQRQNGDFNDGYRLRIGERQTHYWSRSIWFDWGAHHATKHTTRQRALFVAVILLEVVSK